MTHRLSPFTRLNNPFYSYRNPLNKRIKQMQTRDNGNVRYLACGHLGPRLSACNDTQTSDMGQLRLDCVKPAGKPHRKRPILTIKERGIVHGASCFLSVRPAAKPKNPKPNSPIYDKEIEP